MIFSTNPKKIHYTWYRCPKCGNPKMTRLRSDTVLKNFPAYCKYCKQESLLTVHNYERA